MPSALSSQSSITNLQSEIPGARYANRQSAQAQTLEGVGSTPTRATPATAGFAFGRAVGRRAACKAAALAGNVGSIPTRGTRRMRNAEFGIQTTGVLRFSFRIPNSVLRTRRMVT